MKLAKNIAIFGYVGGAINAAIIAIRDLIYSFPQSLTETINLIINSLSFGLIIIVMAVPEGLPLMIALVLALNMKKMLSEQIFVKKMVGIETAGNIQIIFSDKTGTITQGQLTVAEFFTWEEGHITEHVEPSLIDERSLLNVIFNNGAKYNFCGSAIGGNSTDRALLNYVGQDLAETFSLNIVDTEIFDSAKKYSSVTAENGYIYYKGAPEVLLSWLCDHNYELEDFAKHQAEKARRVLAIGYRESAEAPFMLSGFLSITDPVRADAAEAVHNLKQAGVHVMMVTGDRAETAIAVGHESGILNDITDLHFTNDELAAMSDDEIGEQLFKITVVSRATPLTKLRLVDIAQARGIVCGMTGDGVNDGPALYKADVGFAMGDGTEAAKEAGDITILDDSLMSIKNAVAYGRTVFRNIQLFCRHQLSINVSAVLCSFLPVLIATLSRQDVRVQPITIVQFLWINLIMDTLGAAAFGKEPKRPEYMAEKPKARDAAIVDKNVMRDVLTGGLTVTVLGVLFLFYTPFVEFIGIELHSITHTTMFFTFFIFSALINGLTVRAKGWRLFKDMDQNPSFVKIFAGIAIIQVMFVTVLSEIPLFARAFGVTHLTMVQVVMCLCLALIVIPAKTAIQKIIGQGGAK